MQSSNGVEDNIAKIAMLFPDCVTETIDEVSGQPKHLIDFEKLKQNLSDSVMSEKTERYQFTWPDKRKTILLANSPINATLRPCREESVDFANTQNLYIEGDNLDVLKCLKEKERCHCHQLRANLQDLLARNGYENIIGGIL